MDAPGSNEIAAMLKHEGVEYAALARVDHRGDPRDLLAGMADAMVAYSTSEPFVLEQLGAAFRTFSPTAYGADFYGDNLCTSEAEVKTHPERVAAFRSASLKGWAYALAHKEATVDLILKTYSARKSREALLFEAARTDLLVRPGQIGGRMLRTGEKSQRPITSSGCWLTIRCRQDSCRTEKTISKGAG